MALSNWTNTQVIAQLNSGSMWTTSTITYAFPTSTFGLSTSTGETSGFTAFNAAQQAKAVIALGLWDDLISNSIVRTTSSSSNIEFGNSTVGVDYAQAYYPTGGTVWFNPAYSDLATPVIGRHGFMTMVHELGHALGLDHMGNYNGTGTWAPSSYQDSTVLSVMSYFGPNWGSGSANGEGLVAWADWVGADGILYSPQTPMLNDILAIQTMYGADLTTRTADTTYGFNSTVGSASGGIYDFASNLHPIICIYDAGGNDTLDLSGWSTSSTISLVPGTFCSGNSMTNNISISYTTVIENAVGGANADTLIGNAFANTLNGGAGNDAITGGMGNDTIIGGLGTDTATYVGAFSNYAISFNAATNSFTVSGSSDGTDSVTGVEYFQFSDITKSASELLNGVAPLIALPTASIQAVTTSAAEGNGVTTDFAFTIALDHAATASETINYSIIGTGTSAASASDFSGPLTSSIVFAAGETSKTIHVLVNGDTTVELNETFAVNLTSASTGLVLGTSSASATILNDDIVSNLISGNKYNNTLYGTAGADQIMGLAGNDTLYGNGGNDILNGGIGSDRLYGGTGADTFRFTDLHFGADRILDFQDGADKLSFDKTVALAFSEFKITGNDTSFVTVSHGLDSIIIRSSTAVHIAADDFIFV